MIGNDVVDLDDAESRPGRRHPRFDRRAFSDEERALIAASADPERTRWILWAAKESAYKAARQEVPATVFAPSRFAVRFESEGQATVALDTHRLRVEITRGASWVHAVARGAVPDPVAAACVGVAVPPPGAPDPSSAVRRLAVAVLARVLGVPAHDLDVRRDGRVPALWLRGRRAPVDLSLSHHGRFVAFAAALSRSHTAS